MSCVNSTKGEYINDTYHPSYPSYFLYLLVRFTKKLNVNSALYIYDCSRSTIKPYCIIATQQKEIRLNFKTKLLYNGSDGQTIC